MSKRNLFWGKGSGKLGELVLYRAGGVQRARTYISEIKNPKSPLQMAQRVKLANVCGFFRAARAFLENSFTNRPVRQSGFNALASAALRVSNAAISRDMVKEGLSVPLYFRISAGSCPLAAPNVGNVVSFDDETRPSRGLSLHDSPSSAYATTGPITSLDSLKDGLQILINAHPDSWGSLPSVFNINIIISVYRDEGFKTFLRQVRVDRSSGQVVCSGDISPTLYGVYPFGGVSDNADSSTSYLCVGFSAGTSGNGAYFTGAFISYTDENGKLVANNASMVVVQDDENYIDQFRPNGSAYEDYISSLGVDTPDILSTR